MISYGQKNYDPALYADLSAACAEQFNLVGLQLSISKEAGSLVIDPDFESLKTKPLQYGDFPRSLVRKKLSLPLNPGVVTYQGRGTAMGPRLEFDPLIAPHVDSFSKGKQLYLSELYAQADMTEVVAADLKPVRIDTSARLLSARYLINAGVDGEYRNFSNSVSTRVLAIGKNLQEPDTIAASPHHHSSSTGYFKQYQQFLETSGLQDPSLRTRGEQYTNDTMRMALGIIALAKL